jgi:hypothetical protein
MPLKPYSLIALPAALLLTACSGPEPPVDAAVTPFELVADVHHTMEWILDPAADVIWSSAGFIITAEGERDLSPTTEEAWEHVVHNAAILAEGGNLLMLPGRSAGPDWNEYSSGLVKAGRLAVEAAEARDSTALFDAGGRIYQVCKACHNQYWTDEGAAD